jgi:hypothetical protein
MRIVIVRAMIRMVIVIVTRTTRVTQKTTPTALTHTTPTASLWLTSPDAAPLDPKTTANSVPNQHKSANATYPSLSLPASRRAGC